MALYQKEAKVYDIIRTEASSNMVMQGLTGLVGFPVTTVVDATVPFTHYGPMINEIRAVYGRKPVDVSCILPVLVGCKNELFMDLIVDKVIGSVPILGCPVNVAAAKAMTWRLGILFGMLASEGEKVTCDEVRSAMTEINKVFPSPYFWGAPSVEKIVQLLCGIKMSKAVPITMAVVE